MIVDFGCWPIGQIVTYLFIAALLSLLLSICGVYCRGSGFALTSFATQGCLCLCIVCFVLHSVACDGLACLS